MPQSLAQNYQHIVFATKSRQPFLRDAAFRSEMHAYFVGTCRAHESPTLIVGGVADHVHILCRQSKGVSTEKLVGDIKRASSRWAKAHEASFAWQAGYGAFSVSPSHVATLCRYIAEQEEHHKRESLQDDFRRLLKKHRVEYDERYVWD